MSRVVYIQAAIIALSFSYCAYSYVHGLNEITKVQLEIPKIEASIQKLKEENATLEYQVGSIENPHNLLNEARSSSFHTYVFPQVDDVIHIALDTSQKREEGQETNKILSHEIHAAILVGVK